MDDFDLDKVINAKGAEKDLQKAVRVEQNIKENINQIISSYTTYKENCDAIAQKLLLRILNAKELKSIHSARYRIKEAKSLAVKIIKKKAKLPEIPSDDYDIEKYRNLDSHNYYKILMDLIGIRILIRYRTEWLTVHQWIRDNFFRGNEWFVKNCLTDYKDNPGKPFIAEKPKIYYRSNNELSFYKQIDRDFFEFIKSDEGYNSIHYIINTDGKYIEIQVRTIFDEAWSECTHDLVYKNKNEEKMFDLTYLSKCLAQQTNSAELIANLMYIKANDGDNFDAISNFMNTIDIKTPMNDSVQSSNYNSETKTSIKNRIDSLNKETPAFDGKIKNLNMF
ncbi:MAG: hypothetical protein U0L58_02150 [Ruminococcus sp.]|nr:hypothetical protein [Ruminococcus sp.]